ncbi:brefeldin A-inhibited guanine nucleotide-exchange protein 3-like isoform X3 [Branchiostoma floridae]|uniref:Brefeldin A-inhibited guanine nucleotide-exchange protein 3-like isoform X3 n=1 Tax=Branchiostoma floridae TaxID=7739 RepID=A0A9J7LSH1_BRAFL|nr:brefeldin A-inhibited guanine nucleotide-exchange protein 3-like isoform X3 [Branchiostoma floridae]
MEDVLTQISRDASSAKHKAVRDACVAASGILENEEQTKAHEPFQLREKVLEALRLAMETKSSKLGQQAVGGIQKMLVDDRFLSLGEETREQQMPYQILETLKVAPNCSDDVQMEIMKLFLSMTCSPNCCNSAETILIIAEISVETFKSKEASIKTAVTATVSQILCQVAEQLREAQMQSLTDDANDAIAEFSSKDTRGKVESLLGDVMKILKYFCEKISGCCSSVTSQQPSPLLPLYLECVHSMFTSSSPHLQYNQEFLDLVWQQLCPSLIFLLGSPVTDKSVMATSMDDRFVADHGRGSGTSAAAPSVIGPAARTIYGIAAELLRLVGSVESLRPVLQSLWHKILLYPPPHHRLEALKAIKEVLSVPERVVDIAGPSTSDVSTTKHQANPTKKRKADTDLLKLLVDGIAEASHSSNSDVCYTSVSCIAGLLRSVELISQGQALTETQIEDINRQMEEAEEEGRGVTEGDKGLVNGDVGVESKFKGEEEDTKVKGEEESMVETPDTKNDEESKNDKSVVEEESQASKENVDKIEEQKSEDVPGSGEEEKNEGDGSEDVQEVGEKEREEKQEGREPGDGASGEDDGKADQSTSEKEGDAEGQQQDTAEGGTNSTPATDEEKVEERKTSIQKPPASFEMERQVALQRAEMERIAHQNKELERQGARDFVDCLIGVLPSVLPLIEPEGVDDALQTFASRFCAGVMEKHKQGQGSANLPVLNADGVYVATFSALLLNLKLVRMGHYNGQDCRLPMTQKQFIEDVHDSGVLVYLSSTWLGELYKMIVTVNILGAAGYLPASPQSNQALITMLTDIDGMGNRHIGGQMMHDATVSLVLPVQKDAGNETAVAAGQKLVHNILLTCWDSMVDVMAVPLSAKNSAGISNIALILGTEGAKEQNLKDRDAICMSLDGLRKAARLSCTLGYSNVSDMSEVRGVQERCGAVFAQLANASCISLEPSKPQVSPGDKKGLKAKMNKPQPLRLHAAHVLSMDALLNTGLEMGSHSAECWKHVFRCCAYVSHLEHSHFSGGDNQASLPKVQHQKELPQDMSMTYDDLSGGPEAMYMPAANPVIPSINIHEMITEGRKETGLEMSAKGGGVLSSANAAKAVYRLSADVDRLFEEAATSLNLHALVGFLTELRQVSADQLFSTAPEVIDPVMMPKPTGNGSQFSTYLHLSHLGEVMLRCSRSFQRPLLHIMRAWGIVAPHLVEAACHKDRHVSKRAVTCIHDIMIELLNNREEKPHFNFNEALFKPFENLLCLELCDNDVQDQVVSSIAELVEASTTSIKSGWRPLFGALRVVKVYKPKGGDYFISEERHEQPTAPVFDVFEAFLGTENVHVFANAAMDCILCLLKFIRGPHGVREGDSDSDDDDDTDSDFEQVEAPPPPDQEESRERGDLCLPALEYLHRCHKTLASMYTMPSCPVFKGANHININNVLKIDTRREAVDSAARKRSTSRSGGSEYDSDDEEEEDEDDGRERKTCNYPVFSMDDNTGVIRVWFLLLEGLTGSVTTCPKTYQPQTLELLFKLLRSVAEVPGPQFAVFAVTHLLLPMLQSWVRRSHHVPDFWDTSKANFKHACGLSTDLVVEHTNLFAARDEAWVSTDVPVMIRQLLSLLVECIGQPVEAISRLGCACLRHLLLSAGPSFTEEMWSVACEGLLHAVNASLKSVKLLMACFNAGSLEFNGDVGQVRVSARTDCSEMECIRIRSLAQQVFQVEDQQASSNPDLEDDNRSYIFLIHPPDMEGSPVGKRIPFKNVVVGLISHQLLLQLLGSLLLSGAGTKSTAEEHILVSTPMSPPGGTAANCESKDSNSKQSEHLPGLLDYLSPKNLVKIFECLLESYNTACEFDARPGLKFLFQKVGKLEAAANLYKQTESSLTFYMHALIEKCQHAGSAFTPEKVKEILYSKERTSSTCSTASTEAAPGKGPRRRNFKRAQSFIHPELNIMPDVADNQDWVFLRLNRMVAELCSNYIQMLINKSLGEHGADNITDEPHLFLLSAEAQNPKDDKKKVLMPLPPEKKSTSPMGEVHQIQPQGQTLGQVTMEEPQQGGRRGSTDSGGSSAEGKSSDNKEEARAKEEKKERKGKMESIYTLATNKTIDKLVAQYKKHKQHQSMTTFVKEEKQGDRATSSLMKGPPPVPSKGQNPQQSLDGAAEQSATKQQPQQQPPRSQHDRKKFAVMKDSDARVQTWTEIVLSTLQLLQKMPDKQFCTLLPAVFPCINQLVCHVTDPGLRQAVRDWLERIGKVYGIIP